MMQTATDLRLMDSEQEDLLRDVAQRCPIDDGFGVYIARAALLSIDILPMDYVSECELVPSKDGVNEKWAMEESESPFSIYPNPNDGEFAVEYQLDEGSSGVLLVYDMIGQLVFSHQLVVGHEKAALQLTGIAYGVYVLRIEVNGKTELSERISVLRP